jgi:DNA-binding CsgD family transcriptional regulator
VKRDKPVSISSFRLGGVDFVVLSAPIATASTISLTKAERAVLALAVDGLTNAQIAKRRKTSVRTVANQMAGILRKTGVGSRVELASRFGGLR